MYSHQQNFTKALELTQSLRNRYLHTLAAFSVYEKFRIITAPNKVGKKKAEANAKTLSKHVYFFTTVKETARCYFFIELAKFFDRDKQNQSLTIIHLLDFIENNFSSFSKEEFLKYHSNQDRKFIPELFEGYEPFNKEELRRIRRRIQRNKTLIENLKKYRDQFLAHDDLKKSEVHITGGQLRTLFKIIRDVIDLFYLRLDFSSNIYSNYEKEPALAVESVVQDLQEHEKERLARINREFGL